MKVDENRDNDPPNYDGSEYWQRYQELSERLDRPSDFLTADDFERGSEESSEARKSLQNEELLFEITQEYQDYIERVEKERIKSRRRLSLLLIITTATSGVSLTVGNQAFSTGSYSSLVYIIVGIVLTAVALAAALGLARWAIFDIISSANALRR